MNCEQGICGSYQIGYILNNDSLLWDLLELYSTREDAEERWHSCCAYLKNDLKLSAETSFQITSQLDRHKNEYYLLDGEIRFSCAAERLIFELNWYKSENARSLKSIQS